MLKNLKQIDRFYYYLGGMLTVLAIIIIVIIKTIFSSFATASNAYLEDESNNIPLIEKGKLDTATEKLQDRQPPQLDL